MAYRNNIFLREPTKYTRDLDVLKNANYLAANYLHLNTGKPFNECLEYIIEHENKNGDIATKSKQLNVLKRQPNGDRAKAIISFDSVLKNSEKTKAIIMPNMVLYDHPDTNMSCISKYLDDKLKKRKVIKKTGLIAQQNGDMVTFSYCTNEEYAIKVYVNSTSGAHGSPHNSLYNKTAHSSLTSATRTMVSYANASTEKFISGNRHYWSKDVVIENILSIITFTDYLLLYSLVDKYNLYTPTIEDVITLIKRSTKFYWHNDTWDNDILNLVSKLNDYQRVTFVYTNDLYHLRKFNPDLVKTIIDDFITLDQDIVIKDSETVIKSANGGIISLAGILCVDILAGKTIDKVKEESIDNYNQYALTVAHIENTGKKYFDLIQGFMITDNIPSSVYMFPNSIRRSVVGSDTDSCMFTVQEWVEWYYGKLVFGNDVNKVTNLLCYLNNQVIASILAVMSKQIGIADNNLFKLEMKNEYSFPIYMRANRTKHYATQMSAREGNVYKVPKIEIKGVALKDSKVPKGIMEGLEKEIEIIMQEIVSGNKVSIYRFMQRMANLEHLILKSLDNGEIDFLSSIMISPKAAYKLPMSSNYMHYDLWEKVLQHKYGVIAAPPYRAVKVSTTLLKPKLVIDWIKSLDPKIHELFSDWLSQFSEVKETNEIDIDDDDEFEDDKILFENPKKALKMLLLPYDLFENGLPKEFIPIINKKLIVSELMAGFYIILEICGFYIKNKKNTRLVSDDIPYVHEAGLPGSIIKKE